MLFYFSKKSISVFILLQISLLLLLKLTIACGGGGSGGGGGFDFGLDDSAVTVPAPSGPASSIDSTTQITLSWSTGSGITDAFKVAYTTGTTAPSDCKSGTVLDYSNDGSNAVTGLTAGTVYSFIICAVDSSGNYSSGITVENLTTLPAAPPDPTSLTATVVSATEIQLNWTSGGGSTVGFRISYMNDGSESGTCSGGDNPIAEGSITGTSHNIGSLTTVHPIECAKNNNNIT